MKMIAVDDERLVLEDLEYACTALPVVEQFHAFQNPAEALEFVKAQPVDMAFLDIEMPVMTGLELAKQLLEIRPTLAVIFLTGFKEYALEAFGVHAVGYLLKPFSDEMVQAEIEKVCQQFSLPAKESCLPHIHTFGYFDIFLNDRPVRFAGAKAKEFLALLVDRRGGSVSTENAISLLWPDRAYDDAVQSLFRKVLKSLRISLKEAGLSDLLVDTRNQRSVNTAKFTCDVYDLLDGKKGAAAQYRGIYMQGYAWAEPTHEYIDSLLGGKTDEV